MRDSRKRPEIAPNPFEFGFHFNKLETLAFFGKDRKKVTHPCGRSGFFGKLDVIGAKGTGEFLFHINIRIGAPPTELVLDERQRIVGMVSERDLLRVLLIEDSQLSYIRGKTVADVMSAEVITADPVTDVRRIAKVLVNYELSAVPVVDQRDVLIGLVSRSDILRAAANDPPLSLWS